VVMWKKARDKRLRARRALGARVREPRHRVERPCRGRPSYSQFRFDIEDKDDNWCIKHLRFSRAQIIEMTELLSLLLLGLRFLGRHVEVCFGVRAVVSGICDVFSM
jgi:hypothetical protein